MVKFNPKKVRGLMAENKITQLELSKLLKCSNRTLNLKLNEKVKFNLEDVEKLSNIFNKEVQYFFN